MTSSKIRGEILFKGLNLGTKHITPVPENTQGCLTNSLVNLRAEPA
jgi:hypothetical protein